MRLGDPLGHRLLCRSLELLRLGPPELHAVLGGRRFLLDASFGFAGFAERQDIGHYTNRLCSIAAEIKLANSGCGSNGFDLSSGWNCTPMNQGWSVRSTISGNSPSGLIPEKTNPPLSSASL